MHATRCVLNDSAHLSCKASSKHLMTYPCHNPQIRQMHRHLSLAPPQQPTPCSVHNTQPLSSPHTKTHPTPLTPYPPYNPLPAALTSAACTKLSGSCSEAAPPSGNPRVHWPSRLGGQWFACHCARAATTKLLGCATITAVVEGTTRATCGGSREGSNITLILPTLVWVHAQQ